MNQISNIQDSKPTIQEGNVSNVKIRRYDPEFLLKTRSFRIIGLYV